MGPDTTASRVLREDACCESDEFLVYLLAFLYQPGQGPDRAIDTRPLIATPSEAILDRPHALQMGSLRWRKGVIRGAVYTGF